MSNTLCDTEIISGTNRHVHPCDLTILVLLDGSQKSYGTRCRQGVVGQLERKPEIIPLQRRHTSVIRDKHYASQEMHDDPIKKNNATIYDRW